MRPLFVAFILVCSGCQLFFDDGGKGGTDDCVLAETTAAIAPAPRRNPDDLTCVAVGGGCNPDCGPCPALAPEVTWPICGHSCEGSTESACGANPSCRVVRDASCAVGGDCLTDYIGCFPVDTAPDSSIDCFTADAWSCSRDSQCSALHRTGSCLSDDCPRTFATCLPEGADPGRCFEPAECRAVAPPCPANTMPGVANGCWTGACIPLDVCEAT